MTYDEIMVYIPDTARMYSGAKRPRPRKPIHAGLSNAAIAMITEASISAFHVVPVRLIGDSLVHRRRCTSYIHGPHMVYVYCDDDFDFRADHAAFLGGGVTCLACIAAPDDPL